MHPCICTTLGSLVWNTSILLTVQYVLYATLGRPHQFTGLIQIVQKLFHKSVIFIKLPLKIMTADFLLREAVSTDLGNALQ